MNKDEQAQLERLYEELKDIAARAPKSAVYIDGKADLGYGVRVGKAAQELRNILDGKVAVPQSSAQPS